MLACQPCRDGTCESSGKRQGQLVGDNLLFSKDKFPEFLLRLSKARLLLVPLLPNPLHILRDYRVNTLQGLGEGINVEIDEVLAVETPLHSTIDWAA